MLEVEDSRKEYSRVNFVGFQGKLGVDVADYFSLTKEENWRRRRYALQAALSDLLPVSCTARVCYKRPLLGEAPRIVKGFTLEGKEYLTYRGLCRCGNSWICPHCSPRLSEVRREEIEKAVRSWREDRYGVSRDDILYSTLPGKELRLILFTVPHQRYDALGHLLAKIKGAFRWMKTHKSYRSLCGEVNLFGTISVSEVTYGGHGWHPHIHAVWFLDLREVDDNYLSERLFHLWGMATKKFGFGELSIEGFGIQDADFVSSYLTKYGRFPKSNWLVEHELSKWFLKRGERASFGPFDLLESHLLNLCFGKLEFLFDIEDERVRSHLQRIFLEGGGELFVEFANAFRGRHQIQWSRGLKKYFCVEELSDEEAVMEEDKAGGEVLHVFEEERWYDLVREGSRYGFLVAYGRGLV
jgi:hypothetical protein